MKQFLFAATGVFGLFSLPLHAQNSVTPDIEDRAQGVEVVGPDLVTRPPAPEPIENLGEAIARAFAENPTLKAERVTTRGTQYRIPRALGQFGPSINYNLNYGFLRTETNRIQLPDVSDSGWTRSIAATLNQPIFTFGRLSSNLRQARAEVDFQEEVLESTTQQTLFNTLLVYSLVLRDREAVRLAEKNRSILSNLEQGSRRRLAVREITAPDFEQVVTRLELAEANLVIAKSQLAASEAQFLAIVGAPPGDLDPLLPLAVPAGSLDVALDIAVAQNPVLSAAIARERISRAQAKAAMAARLPRIDFQGQAARSPVSPFEEKPTQLDISAVFSVSGTLFSSGVLANRQRELEAFNQADVHLIDQARRDLIVETTSAWEAWKNQEAAIVSQSGAVEAADAAYSGATIQQRAGFRTTLDVLILARDLNSARVSLNTLKYDTYLAKARVLLAVGMLDEEMFGPVSETAIMSAANVVGMLADYSDQ